MLQLNPNKKRSENTPIYTNRTEDPWRARGWLRAIDIKGISWVAEFGGSAVLTQAMKILVDNGVQLKHHSAFLYRPSTAVDQAAQLAHQLGLTLDRNFVHTTTFDYMGNRNQVAMIYNRFKAETGYKVGNACFDLVCQGKNVQGLAGMAITAVGAAGASVALPAIPILAHLGAALGVTAGALKMGSSLAEAITPYWYNKHIGKIK